MQTTKTVYLVRFDKGYYAAKQPNYKWSFTNDPLLAHQYITRKKAEERAEWGLALTIGPLATAEVEEYDAVTTLIRKK